jgi:hypothetical protein
MTFGGGHGARSFLFPPYRRTSREPTEVPPLLRSADVVVWTLWYEPRGNRRAQSDGMRRSRSSSRPSVVRRDGRHGMTISTLRRSRHVGSRLR